MVLLQEAPVVAELSELTQAPKRKSNRVFAVVMVVLAVVAVLWGVAAARDVGRHSPSGQITDAPKTDEMTFPQPPKPTSGHFLIDRGAER